MTSFPSRRAHSSKAATLLLGSPLALALALVGVLALPGCPSSNPPPTDAGTDAGPPDAGPPDSGPPLTCTSTTQLDGVLNDTVSVMFDTRMTEERPRDLGLACGNTGAELRWAPQEVIEFHVPGTGDIAVEFDTVFPETDRTFNTVIQVRSACESVPSQVFPPTCFNDAGMGEVRTQGAVSAQGGDTLFIIVTGFSEPPPEQMTVDEGRVRVDITSRANAAPTVTAGTFLLANDDSYIEVMGSDADGDVRGVAMNFYSGTALLDIYGDGVADPDQDIYAVFFEPPPADVDYTANAVVLGADVNLAGYLRGVGATHVGYRVFDAGWATSDALRVPIEEATLVGFGEDCSATDTVCRPEMTCIGGVCGASGPVGAACSGGIALTVPPITDTRVEIDQSGTTGAGRGNFDPTTDCGIMPNGTVGAETIYTLTLPTGTFDLDVTTDRPGTGDTDTILYMRSSCPDRGSEMDCNDDSTMLRSHVTASDVAGDATYYIFVERYGGLASGTIPHEMRVTVKPVLATGAACDDTGVNNRCAAGACAAGVCP